MNHTAFLTHQESLFQISTQSVKPFNLEIGEHRDIESQNYYIDNIRIFRVPSSFRFSEALRVWWLVGCSALHKVRVIRARCQNVSFRCCIFNVLQRFSFRDAARDLRGIHHLLGTLAIQMIRAEMCVFVPDLRDSLSVRVLSKIV